MTGKNCPNWGKAQSYDDCELCPTFNECMTITIESAKSKSKCMTCGAEPKDSYQAPCRYCGEKYGNWTPKTTIKSDIKRIDGQNCPKYGHQDECPETEDFDCSVFGLCEMVTTQNKHKKR